MTFTKYFLQEGVIKIPPKLFNNMKEHLMFTLLSHYYDTLTSGDESELKFNKYIDKLMSKYGVKKPRVVDDSYIKEFNYNMKNMRGNYPGSKYSQSRMSLILLFGKKDIKWTGKYVPSIDNKKYNGIGLNIGIYHFDKFPNQKCGFDVNLFKEQIADIEKTLEHELMHSVQYLLLKNVDSSQYGGREEAEALYGNISDSHLYYLSKREYDPQIITALSVFNKMVDIQKRFSDEFNYRKVFDELTNTPINRIGKFSSGNTSKTFFAVLKKYDEKRWRDAIKKLSDLLKKRYNISI